MSSTLPWVEKYRPDSLEHLVSNDAIVSKLLRMRERHAIPNLLFYGPPGTGKTSTILAFARTMHGPAATGMLLELNASDERNIATIKQTVHQFVSNRPLVASASGEQPIKFVVLDEADAMTAPAQDALTHLMDRFAERVRFCLICNRISNVAAAVQSRCTKFRFAPLGAAQIEIAVHRVLTAEGIALASPDVMNAILDVTRGDLRRCFNILQACATTCEEGTPLSATAIYNAIGHPSPAQLAALIRDIQAAPTFQAAQQHLRHFMFHESVSLNDIVHLWHRTLPASVGVAFPQHYAALARIERRLENNTNAYLNTACFTSILRAAAPSDPSK